MNIIAILNEIIDENFIVNKGSGGSFGLCESALPNYPETTVRPNGVVLACSFDLPGYSLFPYFNNLSLLKKVCDYVVFYPRRGDVFIFLIELKSSRPDTAFKQLFQTKSFVEFLVRKPQNSKSRRSMRPSPSCC